MKKKLLSVVLAFAMIMQIPLPVFAGSVNNADTNNTVSAEKQFTADESEGTQLTEDELMEIFVQKNFGEAPPVSLFADHGTTYLEEPLASVYNTVSEHLMNVSAKGGSTEVEITYKPYIDYLVSLNLNARGDNSPFIQKIMEDAGMIYTHMAGDHPEYMYWDSHNMGAGYSGYLDSSGNFAGGSVNFYFDVAAPYRGKGAFEGDQTVIDPSKVPAPIAAKENAVRFANEIKATGTKDEKITAMKDKICALTSYNQDAADGKENTAAFPSGSYDPWQLVWVFDEDPSTNVVCEGYSKSFQYLFDMVFADDASLSCYTVFGGMGDKATAMTTGLGGHMWNIVCKDGLSYHADVTNSDEGTAGADGGLFMVRAGDSNGVSVITKEASGKYPDQYDETKQNTFEGAAYNFQIGDASIFYAYDTDMNQIYPDSILDIGGAALYTVNANGAKVSPAKNAAPGTEITVTYEAREGCEFTSWTAKGITLTEEQKAANPLVFTMPENNVEVKASENVTPLLSSVNVTDEKGGLLPDTISCPGTLNISIEAYDQLGRPYALKDGDLTWTMYRRLVDNESKLIEGYYGTSEFKADPLDPSKGKIVIGEDFQKSFKHEGKTYTSMDVVMILQNESRGIQEYINLKVIKPDINAEKPVLISKCGEKLTLREQIITGETVEYAVSDMIEPDFDSLLWGSDDEPSEKGIQIYTDPVTDAPSKVFYVFARVSANSIHAAGPVSEPLEVTVFRAPKIIKYDGTVGSKNVSLNAENNQILLPAGEMVNISPGTTGLYTYKLDELSSKLPEGLTLNEDGSITGTPSVISEDWVNCRIIATDAEGQQSDPFMITFTGVQERKPESISIYDAEGNLVTPESNLSIDRPKMGETATLQFTGKILDQFGDEVKGVDLNWSTAGKGVTVSQSGLVTVTSKRQTGFDLTIKINNNTSVPPVDINVNVNQTEAAIPSAADISTETGPIEDGRIDAIIPAKGEAHLEISFLGNILSQYGDFLKNASASDWKFTDVKGISFDAVSVKMTVTSEAAPGDYVLSLEPAGLTKSSVTIHVMQDPAKTPVSLKIFDINGTTEIKGQKEVDAAIVNNETTSFTAKVFDKYGNDVTSANTINWSVASGGTGVTVSDGIVTVTPEAQADMIYSIKAECGSLYAYADVYVKKRDQLISGNTVINKTFGDSEFNLITAADIKGAFSELECSATAAGPVSFTPEGKITINGTGTGKFIIQAKNSEKYNASNQLEITLNISKKKVNVTAVIPSQEYTGASLNPVPSSVSAEGASDFDTCDYIVTYGENIYAGTNAGSAVISPNEGSNYTFDEFTVHFDITPAEQNISIVSNQADLIRGGSTLNLTDLVSGYDNPEFTISGDAFGSSIDGSVFKSGNTAGAVKINVTLKAKDVNNDGANEFAEKVIENAITVNITDKTAQTFSPAANPGTITYGETFTVVNIPDGYIEGTKKIIYEGVSGTLYGPSETAPEDAGRYKITASYETADSKYTGTCNLAIMPKNLTDAMAGVFDEIIYDGTAKEPVPVMTDGEKTLVRGRDFDCTWSSNVNAGTAASVTITGKVNYAGEITKNFTIDKRTINLANVRAEDKAYDGNKTVAVTADITGILGNEVTVSLTGTAQTENAGKNIPVSVNAVIENDVNSNYKLGTFTEPSVNIERAEINVTDWTWNYTGPFTYDGSAKSVVIKPENTGYSLADITYNDNNMTKAGKYTAKASATAKDANHKVTGSIADCTWQIKGIEIANAPADITAPSAEGTPQTVLSGTNYTGTVIWQGKLKNEKFDFNTVYTAKVTLTPDENYAFNEATASSSGLDNATLNQDGTITGTKTFAATRKAKVTNITAPADKTLEVYCIDKSAVIKKLPASVLITAEDGTTSLAVSWSADTYSNEPGAVNKFTWTADAGNLNADGKALTGEINVTNADALPVTNTGKAAEITYNAGTYDVSKMFTLDANAGAPEYSIVSGGSGAGTLDGKTLTITKAGTIKVKAATAAKGKYAAGEAEAVLTVNKGTGAGTVTIAGWTYGESAKSPVPDSTSNGKSSVTYLYTGKDYSSSSAPVNAGKYKVTATFAETGLYNECTAQADFDIAKKAVTITAKDQDITYAETPAIKTGVSQAEAAGLAGTDKLESVKLAANTEYTKLTPEAAVIKNAGTDVTANYKITYADGTLTKVHDWNAAEYEWAKADGKWTCTATRNDKNNTKVKETDKATVTSKVVKEATTSEMGDTEYTAVFSSDWAKPQKQTVTDIAKLPVFVPSEPETGDIEKDVIVKEENGEIKAEVTDKVITELVDEAIKNAKKDIIINAEAGNTEIKGSITVELPKKTLEEVSAKADVNITIKTPSGNVVLDKKVMAEVTKKAEGTDLKLVIEKRDKSQNTEAALGENAVVSEVKLVSGGKEIHDFAGGRIRVVLPVPEKLEKAALAVLHIGKHGFEKMNAKTVMIDGKLHVEFDTTHFSEFVITDEATADKLIAEQNAEKNDRIREGVKNTKIRASSELVKGGIRVTWKKTPGYRMDGYEVHRSVKKYSGFGKEPYFRAKGTAYKNTKELKKGTRYYYKVRGYRYIDGEKVYTDWSTKAYRIYK